MKRVLSDMCFLGRSAYFAIDMDYTNLKIKELNANIAGDITHLKN